MDFAAGVDQRYRLEIYCQSCWYFRPSFLNYYLSNLLSDSSPPPPALLPCVNKYAVYMYCIQCVSEGEVWGSGPQIDKHLSQSPFTGHIFR
jgi:hypothetical protein